MTPAALIAFEIRIREHMTDLTDKVDTDRGLQPEERETNITIGGNTKEMEVFSSKKTVVKSLLEHDHFDLSFAYGRVDGERGKLFNRKQLRDEAETIWAVKGTMPLGCLTVKSKPRSNNNISSVVNAETIDPEAFSG